MAVRGRFGSGIGIWSTTTQTIPITGLVWDSGLEAVLVRECIEVGWEQFAGRVGYFES